MNVLKILPANPKAENLELKSEILNAIELVIQRGNYILGEECTAFESEFSAYIGIRYALGVSSGTAAIHLSLKALDVKPGDEIITVSHTAVATIAAIKMVGAVPVFVDIDPQRYTIDPLLIEKQITKKTKGIIPVHLYGLPADMDPILKIAKSYGLFVVEDCAQAHGAIYQRKKVGTFGDIGTFSFYPTKNLGAIGDGGMIVTSNPILYEKIKLLRQYGWRERYISEIDGYNSRLDEIQAAILRIKLKQLDKNNNKRRVLARTYNELLTDIVNTPFEDKNSTHVYHLYVIQHKNRDALKEYLRSKGIGSMIHYPQAVHQQPIFSNYYLSAHTLPKTEKIISQILSLPIYPQLSLDAVKIISDQIKEFENV